MDPHVTAWGGAWEFDTSDQATQAAMAQCQAAKANPSNFAGDCKCDLVYSDDTVVLEPSDEAIAAAIVSLRRLARPTLCSNWFASSEQGVLDWPQISQSVERCPGYSFQSVERLRLVIEDVLSGARSADSPDIFPAPPAARKSEIDARRLTNKSDGRPLSGYIGFYPPTLDFIETPHALPQSWHYHFELHRVPHEREQLVLSALRSLERSKMYGRFKPTLTGDVRLPYFNPSDQFARYTRAYDVSEPEVRAAFSLDPERSRDGLIRGERSITLWVESVIPIDEDWVPVGQPLRSVTPIAVQTDRALYLYGIGVVPQRGGGGSVGHFEGRVLDLSACAGTSRCVQDAQQALAEELAKAFQRPPLSAAPVKNRVLPPSQVRLQRITEESLVLQGLAGPFFEMSTYTATFWPGPRDSFMGSGGNYFVSKTALGPSDQVDQVYLQIEQALQISVGRKGSYEEPARDQYAAYERAVTAAVQSAIALTTKRLGGTVSTDGVGVIPAKATP
jgi:hypothetical protein